MAATTVRARVKGGVLEPLEKLDLPEGDEVVVTISPASPHRRGEGLEHSFGAWKDLIDCDALERTIYESRSISARPEPKL